MFRDTIKRILCNRIINEGIKQNVKKKHWWSNLTYYAEIYLNRLRENRKF
jgi:hypothetical protein